jgi:hypothetical protein
MTAVERQYLTKAFEVEEHIRPRGTYHRVIPLLSWRTIGVLCDLSGEEADQLVDQLVAAGQIRVVNSDQRLMVLTEGREVGRAEVESRKRRFWNRLPWIVVPLGLLLYWLIHGF